MRWRSAMAGLLVLLAGGLAACGDSNLFEGSSDSSGRQSQLEEGLAALDAENWDEAIRIFSEMDTSDPDVRRYLASAYVGKAGFDTLTLVQRIAEAQESGSTESVLYDAVTEIFDEDGDGVIDSQELGEKSSLFLQALQVLGVGGGGAARVLAAVDTTGMTDTEIFQAGVYAAIHAVLSIVEQLEYPPGSGQYLLTLDALREHAEVIDSVTVPEGFNDDLAWVREAVGVLSPELVTGSQSTDGNDIAEDLDRFLRQIGYLPDEKVTDDELRSFLRDLIGLAR